MIKEEASSSVDIAQQPAILGTLKRDPLINVRKDIKKFKKWRKDKKKKEKTNEDK